MDQIINYINPELLVLVPVLLLAGAGIKHTGAIADKWIPLILGVAGVALSLIWVIANGTYTGPGTCCWRPSRQSARASWWQAQPYTPISWASKSKRRIDHECKT